MLLAWKEMKRNKVRYFLISTIMVAVLFLVFFITALSNGLGYADTAAISNLQADQVILNKDADGVLIKSRLDSSDIREIESKIDGNSSPLSITISTLEKKNEKSVDVVYFTVDTKAYGNLEIVEGKTMQELTDGEIIADESLKRKGFAMNDKIEDSRTGKELTVAGFTKNHVYSHMPVIFTDVSEGFQSIYSGNDTYNAILVKGDKVTLSGYHVQTLEDTVKTIPGHAETQGSFTVMKTFLIVISVFVSSVFFYVITIQKLHQFGVLKALGMKTFEIAQAILVQVVLLTFVGLAISALAFLGIVQVLPEEMPFVFSIEIMMLTGALFLVLNMFGALLSIWKVTKIDPLEAMGRIE